MLAAADGVFVLSSRDGETFLDAYDPALVPLWRERLGAEGIALLAAGETPCVFDVEGAWTFGTGGAGLVRVKPRPREQMRLSTCAYVGDGFVFGWQHADHAPMRPPVLERADLDGTSRWSATLPVGPIAYEGVVTMRADEGWTTRPMDAWVPETWFVTSPALTLSGDAVLACFTEMPRSGIGYGYVVSLADGALRFATKRGPVSNVAPLGGGAFLVGYQGYGAFETLRYERDGRVSQCWPSHGHYLVAPDDLRVIELENVLPSKMHLARLQPGGRVTKGDWLDGYYTSPPLHARDGTAYFFRKGAILAARGLSIDQRLTLIDRADHVFSTAVRGHERRTYVAYSRERPGQLGGCLVRVDV